MLRNALDLRLWGGGGCLEQLGELRETAVHCHCGFQLCIQ